MKKIIIVLGSNHEQEKNVGFAMNQLSQNFLVFAFLAFCGRSR